MRIFLRLFKAIAGRPLEWLRVRRRRSFAFRFYTTLVPWIVAVNLLIAAAAALWGLGWARSTVEENRTDAIQSLVFAIAKPLHDFEFGHLQSLLEEFPRNGSIERTWVTDDTGFEVAHAGRTNPDQIAGVIDTPIIHRKANSVVSVGTLHVAYSDDELVSVALWISLHSLLITLATTIVAIVITVRLSQTSVIAPLQHLANAITRTRKDGTRHRVRHPADGEFGTVIDGFNAMQARLDRDEQALLEVNSKLKRAATQDSLTGLRNRAGFEEAASDALMQAQEAGTEVAMLFIDLNRFKSINDTFGHAVGDKVLRTVGQRIVANVPADAITARLSGDEFVVMLTGDGVGSGAPRLAERLGRRIGAEFSIEGHPFRPVGSIGFVVTRDDYSLASLMMKADAAMYEMKKSAGSAPAAYTQGVEARAQERISAEKAVAEGLFGEYFDIAIQPIVELDRLGPVGGEVLLRLNHPVQGALEPSAFIPVAEDCGLMPQLGLHVFERALQALEGGEIGPQFYLSVNVSSVQITEEFLIRVGAMLLEYAVDPRRIVLELTESVAMKEAQAQDGLIRRLQEMGIRVALDDFGTGYSSLSYIAKLRPDIVKIDRTFVQAASSAGQGFRRRMGALGDAMARICCDLDLPMVGEGIETERDLAYCRRAGVRFGQGYLFARPMPLREFSAWTSVRHPVAHSRPAPVAAAALQKSA